MMMTTSEKIQSLSLTFSEGKKNSHFAFSRFVYLNARDGNLYIFKKNILLQKKNP